MKPDIDMMRIWRRRLNNAIGIMDDRGRGNEGNNSRMLWNREWDEVRGEIFNVMEYVDLYLKHMESEER